MITWPTLFLFFVAINADDLPCIQKTTDYSPLCVCNSTYCDEVSKGDTLTSGQYRMYTTDQDGRRFEKSEGEMSDLEDTSLLSSIFTLGVILNLDPSITYQTIEGFGGAVTDSAGINWRKLDDTAQQKMIETYYGSKGLEYNFVRVPIGGSDFSTYAYTYNETPENDKALSNFSLSYEDFKYKIPMIQSILNASTEEIKVLATAWSPPVWMKSNGEITGGSRLLEEYYQSYADYHLRFIEEYEKNGIDVWGVSTTNEPVNGIIPLFVKFNSLGFPPADEANWVVNNLGPTIRNSKYNATKILAVDDQRYTLPLWVDQMVAENSTVLDYIDGIAIHYYGDFIAPASLLTKTHEKYPEKFILATEACTGSKPWDFTKVIPGSWSRAVEYAEDIFDDLNNWVVGWIDWNLALDMDGGPNWAENYVDSPILIPDDGTEFYKQPMFYAVGHFSKFIPPGSIRIELTKESTFNMYKTAFLRPDGSYVVVLLNGAFEKDVQLKIPSLNKQINLTVNPHSLRTIEIYP